MNTINMEIGGRTEAVGLNNQRVGGSKSIQDGFSNRPAVKNEISVNTVKAFDAVDSFMNLGNPNRLAKFSSLSPEEREKFFEIIARLAKSGYMGYEVFEKDGQRIRVDLDMQIGDHRQFDRKIHGPDYGLY